MSASSGKKEDPSLREITRYTDAAFPVEIFHGDRRALTPPGRWLKDFHWHEELQITMAVSGTVRVQAGSASFELKTGEALFINSGVIHAVTSTSHDGAYESLNFSPRILSFFPGSRMEQNDVLPFISSGRTTALFLSADGGAGRVLELFSSVSENLASPGTSHSEYRTCILLATLWYNLLDLLAAGEKGAAGSLIREKRLQHMLSFINENYMNDISLADIAGAANISISECCRIFRSVLGTAPHAYLTNYRIQQSVNLLAGDRTIDEIAGMSGFNQTSNYIAGFKKIIGETPARYRKRKT